MKGNRYKKYKQAWCLRVNVVEFKGNGLLLKKQVLHWWNEECINEGTSSLAYVKKLMVQVKVYVAAVIKFVNGRFLPIFVTFFYMKTWPSFSTVEVSVTCSQDLKDDSPCLKSVSEDGVATCFVLCLAAWYLFALNHCSVLPVHMPHLQLPSQMI